MMGFDNRDLVELMFNVPVSAPVLDVRLIPEPLRSEMLSSYCIENMTFPEGDAPLCVYTINFAFWCGVRLMPGFSVKNHREFSLDYIESLKVNTVSPRAELEPKAIFQPGGSLINLMSRDGEVLLGRVAFGKPYRNTFELRHCYWLCTSLVISKYLKDEQLVLYTKSGSEYRLEPPFDEVNRPIDILPWLRKGFGPNRIEIIEWLKGKGIGIYDIFI